MKQSFFNYHLYPNLTIDDFYVGNANLHAFNLLIKEDKNNDKLILIGPDKSGKSHLSTIWQDKNKALKYDANFNFLIENERNILIDDLFKNLNEEEIFHLLNHCHWICSPCKTLHFILIQLPSAVVSH